MNQLLSDQQQAKQRLEAQIEETLALVQKTKQEAEEEKVAMETQYRNKLTTMESEHELVLKNHAKCNDDTTERMQKEIETVQVTWQQEQQRMISELQAEHELAIQSLHDSHSSAIQVLEQKLTAAMEESMALKSKVEVNLHIFYRKFYIHHVIFIFRKTKNLYKMS